MSNIQDLRIKRQAIKQFYKIQKPELYSDNYINKMSLMKCKKTTDRVSHNQKQKQTKQISHSASKMSNRLSMSFYGQDTLKKQKQVILDMYENVQTKQEQKTYSKAKSQVKERIGKSVTPNIMISRGGQKKNSGGLNKKTVKAAKVNLYQSEKTEVKSSKESRQSSVKSSKSNKLKEILFNYISNRVDSSAKGWQVLKKTSKQKSRINNQTKHRKKQEGKMADIIQYD